MVIEGWFRDLVALPEGVWAEYARRQDPLGRLVTIERYLEFYKECAESGRREANGLAPFLPLRGGVLEDLAASLGATVTNLPAPQGSASGPMTFARFVEPDRIELYADNLEATQELLDDGGLTAAVGRVSVRDVLLAHELFHVRCLGRDPAEMPCLRPHVNLLGYRVFRRRSALPSLEEVSAMAFARELTSCPCSPYVLTVLMLLPQAPEAAAEQHRVIMGIAREIEG